MRVDSRKRARGGESEADKKGKPPKECVIQRPVIGAGLDCSRPSKQAQNTSPNHLSGKPGHLSTGSPPVLID